MAHGGDRLVWIDCEMTGLDLEVDQLVEVAVVVTDSELQPVDPGFQIVIRPDQSALDHMGQVVTDMHTASGLLEAIPSGASLAEAEFAVLEYIQRHAPVKGQAPLAGNTIGTDRAFILRYMPRVDDWLHYRSIDVSSIKELTRRWYPRIYYTAPQKHGGHRALADILESIRELDYYRKALFVPQPGPSTEDLQGVSAQVVEQHAPRL